MATSGIATSPPFALVAAVALPVPPVEVVVASGKNAMATDPATV